MGKVLKNKVKKVRLRSLDNKKTMTSDSVSTKPTKKLEKIPIRSSSRESVFDRLYKTSTASSKTRKEVAPVKAINVLMRENEEPTAKKIPSRNVRPKPLRPVKKPSTSVAESGVFNRLYEKGTASSRAAMKPKNTL